MRPTHLQLRSPKERTEYTTNPQISHHGKLLFHHSLLQSDMGSPNREMRKTFCFAPSDRFGYYKWQHKRMPVNLGPGSYDPLDSFNKLAKQPCQVVVKPLHNHR